MVRNDKRNGYVHAPVVSPLVGDKVEEETHVRPLAPTRMGWRIEPGMVYILHLLVGWRGCTMHMHNVTDTQCVAEWCSHTGYFEVWEETERCSGPWVKRLRHITPARRSVPRPRPPPPPPPPPRSALCPCSCLPLAARQSLLFYTGRHKHIFPSGPVSFFYISCSHQSAQ
jgi:hypothetical protein